MLLRHLLSFLLLCPFSTLFVITLFTYLETLYSDVLLLLQGCYCLPDLHLFFLGTQRLLMEYQDCLFVLAPMLVFTVILGEEIERKMRIGIKQYSIALPKRALMRQFELKVRTCSLKSALRTCCQTPARLCGVHRIWAETLSLSFSSLERAWSSLKYLL